VLHELVVVVVVRGRLVAVQPLAVPVVLVAVVLAVETLTVTLERSTRVAVRVALEQFKAAQVRVLTAVLVL
jgi:hypothetical protein